VSTERKLAPEAPKARHPARPSKAALDLKARHDRIAKRFPKVLSELAK